MDYNFSHTVADRLMKYVQVDTEADPNSNTFPSSEKQKDLSRILVKELIDLGVTDAFMDEHGYVFGTVKSNSDKPNIPTICFCSHVDTTPDVTGKNVKPILHRNYDGKPMVLPDDLKQVITTDKHPYLKEKIGDDKVVLGLSGGVDSTVAAILLHKAIGQNLYCIFVNNGLLRKDEFSNVLEQYKGMGLNVKGVDASDLFMSALKDKSDPEQKRKAIGGAFIDVFDQQATAIKDVVYLAQGTIYPDVIESVSVNGPSVTIKSHHNVGGLPDYMKLKIVEPLRMLFKDEVRRVGAQMGIDPKLLGRHPFPGPGLGVRILGEVKLEFADLLRKADHIFMEELNNFNLYDSVDQAFAVFLPVKSVGVAGDERRYDYVIALRAVETIDFMTARWARLPYDFLDHVSNRIMNEVNRVSRVVYDISGKPPSTIEWE